MTKSLEKSQYTEEQERTLRHFNDRSDYWYEIYQNEGSYTNYALQKQQRFVLELVDRTENAKRILDIGCGAGITALELAHKGYEVSGIDLAPNMIQRARAEARQRNIVCDFRVGIAENLPYPGQSFDVLLALGLLGNILDDRLALTEMARVLKSRGRLIVTMPNLLALDLLIALPKSLPIMLGATQFRQPLRVMGNIGRRLIGRDNKDVSTLRFNQCVMPLKFVRHLRQNGFGDVKYSALTFGPIKPLGLQVLNDQLSISISEKIASWVAQISLFDWAGSIIVYDCWRTG